MFSFTSYGVPVIFAAALLISMSVGAACMWDMWRRRPQISYLLAEVDSKIPTLWDLLTEDPIGSKFEDGIWGNLLPLSVTRITTEPPPRPTTDDTDMLTTMQRMQRAHKASGMGDDSRASQDLLQIAVAIAMPFAQLPPRNATDEISGEPLLYCIGLHRATVTDLEV
ncbi:hypothetical protein DFH09DRAFT_1145042 [Mycena vulgaris]|nr:hypothetical protein DFH09DRAFT_1145042 [Mycena vulgaris]